MRNVLGLSLIGVLATACGGRWNVTNQQFFRYQNQDVRFAGEIQMAGKPKELLSIHKGADVQARLYSDNYETVIYETDLRLGSDLDSDGDTQTNEIFTIPITEIRLGGTSNSYPNLCAAIRADDSNISDWIHVGCINDNDPPSESPTGGLGQT